MAKLIFATLSTLINMNASAIKCTDFDSRIEAQAYFEDKQKNYKRMDKDKDGIAREKLPEVKPKKRKEPIGE